MMIKKGDIVYHKGLPKLILFKNGEIVEEQDKSAMVFLKKIKTLL